MTNHSRKQNFYRFPVGKTRFFKNGPLCCAVWLAVLFVQVTGSQTGGVQTVKAQAYGGHQQNLFVSQTIAAKRIYSLKAMVNRIESFYGGRVLDASLVTPVPERYESWYYIIKHRAPNGFVSNRRYWAFNGEEAK